jgi:hypothetical protein
MAEVFLALGRLCLEIGQVTVSANALEQGLAIARSGSARRLYGELLVALGSLRQAQGDNQGAAAAAAQAFDFVERSAATRRDAQVLIAAAGLLADTGDLQRANSLSDRGCCFQNFRVRGDAGQRHDAELVSRKGRATVRGSWT